MNRLCLSRPLSGFVIMIAACATQLQAQPTAGLERLVPKQAAFAIVLDEPSQLAEAFAKTQPGQILSTSPWQDYQAKLREAHVFCALNLRPCFGLDWNDMVEANAATLILGAGGEHSGLGMLMEIPEDRASSLLIPRIEDYFKSQNAASTEFRQADVTGRKMSRPTDSGQPDETVVLYHAGCLAIFSSHALAKHWIDFTQEATAADPMNLAVPKDSSHPEGVAARLIVNPTLSVDWILQQAGPDSKVGDLISLQRLGLAQLVRAAVEIQLVGNAPVDIQMNWSVEHDTPLSSGMRLLAYLPSKVPVPAAWVDASVLKWSSTSLDTKIWFEGLGSWFDERTDPEVPGAFEDVLDGLASDPEGPQIRVRQELVPLLGGQMTSLTWPRKPGLNEGPRPQLFTIGVQDAAALASILNRYFEGDDVVTSGETNGYQFWHTTGGEALFMATGESDTQSPTAIALSPDTLVLSSQQSTIYHFIRRAAPKIPLRDSPRGKAAEAALARLSHEPDVGVSISSSEAFIADAYRGILPATQSTVEVSPSTALLGLVLAGSDWRASNGLGSQLPKYSAEWLKSVGDVVTGSSANQEQFWGSTFLLLQENQER